MAALYQRILCISICVIAFGPTNCRAADTDNERTVREHFEKKVRPILIERCYECHSGSAKRIEGSLRVDHATFLFKGGDSGPVVDTTSRNESLLLQAIRYDGLEMPPSGKLPAEEVEILTQWIQSGAYWPEEPVPTSAKVVSQFSVEKRKQEHWVWKPIAAPEIPAVENNSLRASSLDAFVINKQAEHGLAFSSEADQATLIRRLHWDLLGIPASSDTLQQWMYDSSSDWFERYLDSLLADPQLGVRFARHWLDLVRYAQSRGHEFDEDTPGAEQYRDYIVRAWNADVPFDQLVREHIAGDLIPSPRRHPTREWNESVLGTGFWHLGEWVHSPVDTKKDECDRFDNMVDVFSKTFLGLTVSCARCHDHKFDAISSEDYYALYGYLRSSHYRLVRFETDAIDKRLHEELLNTRAMFRERVKDAFDRLQNVPSPIDREQVASLAKDFVFPIEATDPRVRFDSRTISPDQWHTDGMAFGQRSLSPGWESLYPVFSPKDPMEFTLRWSSFPSISADQRWLGQQSSVHKQNSTNRHTQIETAGKTFLTPSFTLTSAKLSYLIRGECRVFVVVDSHRLVAGPLHGETVIEFKSSPIDSMRWVTGNDLSRYVGKRVHLEISPIGGNAFDLYQVIEGNPPERREPNHEQQHALEFGIGMEAFFRRVLTNPAEVAPNEPEAEVLRIVQDWAKEERKFADETSNHSQLAMAMQDGSGQNDFLLIRGNPDRPGQEVPRRFLEALGGKERQSNDVGSGRLALANELMRADNPLVARVFVNRLWHHLIGKGIVPTTDDFGAQGTLPSHPELLDFLSTSLRDSGWSFKQLVRQICMSHTYRQGAAANGFSSQDPTNQWLAFANIKKLEGEAVRDGMLAAAGMLDLQLEGKTEPVHLNDFLTGRGRPNKSGTLEAHGRRSLYLEVRRNFLNPMLTAFDMPTPFSSMGRRNVSNVPAQALTMLNDPLVHWIADQWASIALRGQESIEVKVATMLRSTRGREPSGADIENGIAFVLSETQQTSEREAWKSFAHVLLNSKEMLFRF